MQTNSYPRILSISTIVTLMAVIVVTLLAFVVATSEDALASLEIPAFIIIGLTVLGNSILMVRKNTDKPTLNVVFLSLFPAILVLFYLYFSGSFTNRLQY